MQKVIQQAAPDAFPCIKYGMPTYFQVKNLAHFAAWKEHIGLYPSASAIIAFEKELKGYTTSKGAIQFPVHQTIPYELISRIIEFRVKDVLAKNGLQRKKSIAKNKSAD